MVTADRKINHAFDRLESILRTCRKMGSINQADELITDLKVMVTDHKASTERLMYRYSRILHARDLPVKKYDYTPMTWEESNQDIELYKQLQKRQD